MNEKEFSLRVNELQQQITEYVIANCELEANITFNKREIVKREQAIRDLRVEYLSQEESAL